jgi:hypothetical protein
MNVEELEEALDELFPGGFSIETDPNGQLIILTHLCQDDDGELFPMDEEESDEYDDDTEQLEDEDDDED